MKVTLACITSFVGGVFLTIFMVTMAPETTRFYLHKFLEAQLQKDFQLSSSDLAQGQHLATGYYYGTVNDVSRWYYQMKVKYGR